MKKTKTETKTTKKPGRPKKVKKAPIVSETVENSVSKTTCESCFCPSTCETVGLNKSGLICKLVSFVKSLFCKAR